jgi:hypothetical protein
MRDKLTLGWHRTQEGYLGELTGPSTKMMKTPMTAYMIACMSDYVKARGEV